jgi:hypothetical protein
MAKRQNFGVRRIHAGRLQRAINYLYGTPIDKKSLELAVNLLKTLHTGVRRGWLYPEELAKIAKLIERKPARKHAAA